MPQDSLDTAARPSSLYLIVAVTASLSAALTLTPELRADILVQRNHLQDAPIGGIHLPRLSIATRPEQAAQPWCVEAELPSTFTPLPGFGTAYLNTRTLRIHAVEASEGRAWPVDLDALLAVWPG
ncbi:hypothetical protein [Deinococcus ruber]|uniref:Uncharacterized protein n=1 Tax=Deinococcus ruber TaxID=1848197 RepID=A0A918FHG6_9DEIO|nr:hypothetical protein [Deinococcus ruber]GGR37911.1 hypothetical protein GCM10008957_54010 [Deinococcus ruber]